MSFVYIIRGRQQGKEPKSKKEDRNASDNCVSFKFLGVIKMMEVHCLLVLLFGTCTLSILSNFTLVLQMIVLNAKTSKVH